MRDDKPRLSIGLPVYNGEKFLGVALNSLLEQSFGDFELIISDNASTDKTPEICQTYAAKDIRIAYYRNDENIGAARNFYKVLDLSKGEYFKWAAYDDLHAQEFIEKCVGILDKDTSIVLSYPRAIIIDQNGAFLRNYNLFLDTASVKPHERFYNMVSVDHWCFQTFGVMRANIIKNTRRFADFYGWDRNMLADISLRGRVYEIPEFLFFRREHSQTSGQLFYNKQKQLGSYDPTITWHDHSLGFKRFFAYATSIKNAPIDYYERLLCFAQLARLAAEKSTRRLNHSIKHLFNLNLLAKAKINKEG